MRSGTGSFLRHRPLAAPSAKSRRMRPRRSGPSSPPTGVAGREERLDAGRRRRSRVGAGLGAKIEYLYLDLGSRTTTYLMNPPISEARLARLSANVITTGVNYRFYDPIGAELASANEGDRGRAPGPEAARMGRDKAPIRLRLIRPKTRKTNARACFHHSDRRHFSQQRRRSRGQRGYKGRRPTAALVQGLLRQDRGPRTRALDLAQIRHVAVVIAILSRQRAGPCRLRP